MPDPFTILLSVLWFLAGVWTFARAAREANLSGFRYPLFACLPLTAMAVALSVGFAFAPQVIFSSTILFWALVFVGVFLPAVITALAERRAQNLSPEKFEHWRKLKQNTSAIRAFFFYIGVSKPTFSPPGNSTWK